MTGERDIAPSSRAATAARIVRETVLVTIVGGAVALLANQISPRGLSLTRNYFPPLPAAATTSEPRPGPAAGNAAPLPASGAIPQPSPKTQYAAGPRIIALPEVVRLFRSPEFEQELVLFVDARNARQYAEGHIPGAYPFDRYRPEADLPVVLPPCLNANRVVVYCTGGQCEDSHFAAKALEDAGVPPERLAVFAGGIGEWTAGRLPIETGARGSGTLQPGAR